MSDRISGIRVVPVQLYCPLILVFPDLKAVRFAIIPVDSIGCARDRKQGPFELRRENRSLIFRKLDLLTMAGFSSEMLRMTPGAGLRTFDSHQVRHEIH